MQVLNILIQRLQANGLVRSCPRGITETLQHLHILTKDHQQTYASHVRAGSWVQSQAVHGISSSAPRISVSC